MTGKSIGVNGEFVRLARQRGYSREDLIAGREHYRRKSRETHPPGTFDKAGRVTANERTHSTTCCRAPSRKWPYPEMQAARTARHCAEVFDATELHVKRIARALEVLNEPPQSAHEHIEQVAAVQNILKAVRAPRKAATINSEVQQ